MGKAAKVKEESKRMSVVMDWIKFDKTHVNTPSFGHLTQAFARQQLPSIQLMRTTGNTRGASTENCFENLNLSSGDGLQ